MDRRSFMAALAALSATSWTSSDVHAAEDTADQNEKSIPGEVCVIIEDSPLHWDEYPGDDDALSSGEAYIFTPNQTDEVTLGIASSEGDRQLDASLTFDPDDAERIALLLLEFVEKARAGEDWWYNT